MKDIMILKRCGECRKHLTLRESVRTGEEGSEGVFVVEYCSHCGAHPITEIIQVAEVLSTEKMGKPKIKKRKYTKSKK